MRVLLDTQCCSGADGTSAASQAVRDAEQDPSNEVMFSAVSIWEIAIKAAWARGASISTTPN